MADASKWRILRPAQSHTAGQTGGRAQQWLPHPSWLALNRAHAVGVGWGCTIPSGASRELGHRPRAQPAPICCQESKGAAFVPRVGCSNRPGGRRRPDSSDRRIDRDQSTKASKRVGPAAGFLLASARDLRFSPRAIQQGNVGLLGTRNGITRSLGRRVKTPDSSRSYADPVLNSIKRCVLSIRLRARDSPLTRSTLNVES